MIMTAKSIRRTCLTALRDQFARFESREFVPMLPPPRFKVEYCPFANQLRKDLKESKSSNLRAKKVRPNHRHDDRELCPHCDACISVTPHSGLPAYRGILFTSHVARDHRATDDKTTFACNSCYKTFEDSYAFLDHVFQKQVGSDRSCMRRASSRFTLNEEFMESDPSLVEQCLKNCLMRELTRARTEKMLKSTIRVVETEIHPSSRDS
jgi:ferredoxin